MPKITETVLGGSSAYFHHCPLNILFIILSIFIKYLLYIRPCEICLGTQGATIVIGEGLENLQDSKMEWLVKIQKISKF